MNMGCQGVFRSMFLSFSFFCSSRGRFSLLSSRLFEVVRLRLAFSGGRLRRGWGLRETRAIPEVVPCVNEKWRKSPWTREVERIFLLATGVFPLCSNLFSLARGVFSGRRAFARTSRASTTAGAIPAAEFQSRSAGRG